MSIDLSNHLKPLNLKDVIPTVTIVDYCHEIVRAYSASFNYPETDSELLAFAKEVLNKAKEKV